MTICMIASTQGLEPGITQVYNRVYPKGETIMSHNRDKGNKEKKKKSKLDIKEKRKLKKDKKQKQPFLPPSG